MTEAPGTFKRLKSPVKGLAEHVDGPKKQSAEPWGTGSQGSADRVKNGRLDFTARSWRRDVHVLQKHSAGISSIGPTALTLTPAAKCDSSKEVRTSSGERSSFGCMLGKGRRSAVVVNLCHSRLGSNAGAVPYMHYGNPIAPNCNEQQALRNIRQRNGE
jgi:hypothetical protein